MKDIRTDISQMAEEGHDESALLQELEAARSKGSLDALAALQEDLWQRPSPADYLYDEPNDWESISGHFPVGGPPGGQIDDDDLADRLLAAWRGRCAGCQLGKPVEGATPSQVREVLGAVGSWPLLDYMNPVDEQRREALVDSSEAFRHYYHPNLCKGGFDSVAPDDDIHYAITSQMVLERFGTEFTGQQAIDMVVELTPVSFLWAAGRSMFRTSLFGLTPAFTAIYGNPSRQSLGGQIRCDAWGWAAPGDPLLAARMAYRDALNSQVRNGIYSAIFFSALMASALVQRDALKALEIAERYVPPRSRFAEMLQFVKAKCAAQDSWEGVNEAIYGRYPVETRVVNHSLPNAAIVVMALLKGDGDFGKTIGISVMAGMDTDCNGATAGSIMGCALGTQGIPAHWTDPFNDRIRTHLKGLSELSITEMAERMYRVARRP
ncbi:MAG: ADP-ribosylglycohydrolase family protein [Armatimonadetes bacterium]|nr:ADP-ribosylglycohydrolase family protein [Armatimonadota bacterium]